MYDRSMISAGLTATVTNALLDIPVILLIYSAKRIYIHFPELPFFHFDAYCASLSICNLPCKTKDKSRLQAESPKRASTSLTKLQNT